MSTKKVSSEAERPTMGDALRRLRTSLGTSQKGLARLIGVTPGAVGQWEINKTKPSPMALMALGKLAGDEKAWWFAQAGQDYADVEETVDRYKELYLVDEKRNRILMIHAHAGTVDNRFIAADAIDKLSVPRSWFGENQAIKLLPVADDAMAPVIRAGSLVFVDIHDHKDFERLISGIVALRHPHGVRVGQLQRRAAEYYVIFQNLGPEYTPVPVSTGDHSLVGLVIYWLGGPNPVPQLKT